MDVFPDIWDPDYIVHFLKWLHKVGKINLQPAEVNGVNLEGDDFYKHYAMIYHKACTNHNPIDAV